mmetsp:Transcript_96206/g.229167  ORF Transcript_96206/g.229167 Transcript_96206/m.229167 type:complete len:81 (-) Transcript_96206:97-339(-)|eukprot:CAMPEP_0181403554 /NCGR_PEP_ID=MMETSP1110-20121109/3769_1 /TAXON_ID=174948 /ORGANISM="Symbiodinium sp., Strain CCMP421" /LENGTH=80 /DNA_ID=CAMNT_0023525845 /DNA_START=96 /DNA_END=338 /DNA_ORIENTATION=+
MPHICAKDERNAQATFLDSYSLQLSVYVDTLAIEKSPQFPSTDPLHGICPLWAFTIEIIAPWSRKQLKLPNFFIHRHPSQ